MSVILRRTHAHLTERMGLYATYVFPRLMDWVMTGEEFYRLRSSLLKDVRGKVLEIGFGTGLNLAHYPSATSHLSVIDPAGFLPDRVARRIASARFAVECFQLPAEELPFRDCRFDWVVSTWTLCTIADPIKALGEVRRVLKPDGRFLFLEHGKSDDIGVAEWQDRLNPIQKVLGCGCNLNRRIDQLIERSGFIIPRLDRFQMRHIPRLVGEMYLGQAERNDSHFVIGR